MKKFKTRLFGVGRMDRAFHRERNKKGAAEAAPPASLQSYLAAGFFALPILAFPAGLFSACSGGISLPLAST